MEGELSTLTIPPTGEIQSLLQSFDSIFPGFSPEIVSFIPVSVPSMIGIWQSIKTATAGEELDLRLIKLSPRLEAGAGSIVGKIHLN